MSKSLKDLEIIKKERRNGHHTVYTCKCRNNECINEITVIGAHQGYCKECKINRQKKRPYETIYNVFLKSIKTNDITTNLVYEEFFKLASIKECHYCQAATIRSEFKKGNYLSGYMIDRKDNALPYTFDNCVSCCWYCNNLKSDRFSYEEFVKLRQFIKTEFGR